MTTVNTALWNPGKQTHVSQTDKQTRRLLYPWLPTHSSAIQKSIGIEAHITRVVL